MKRTGITLLFALAIVIFAQSAFAQFKIGPRVGYELDEVGAFAIGADVRFSPPALPIAINPTFDYYFVDKDATGDASLWQANINALYDFGIANQVFTPFVGVGLALTNVSLGSRSAFGVSESGTSAGANILVGAEFGFGAMRPFVQAQTTLGGDLQTATIAGGLLFSLGL
jgi:hypothetical protein